MSLITADMVKNYVLNKLEVQGDFNRKKLWRRHDNITEKCPKHTKIPEEQGRKNVFIPTLRKY